MATLSFTSFFDFNQRKCRIQDTSNYPGQSLSPSNVKGVVKITSPRGVIYDNTDYNTPDINPSVDTYSGYIQLPIDKLGFILSGTYTITYTIQESGVNISQTSNTYTYTFIIPEIIITQNPDGYNSTFGSVDSTNYGSPSILTRTHEVTPPSGSPLLVISNNNSSITYSANIWSGDWVTQITTILTYVLSDGLVVTGSITATKTVKAYLNDMNVIRGYIQSFDQLYEQSRSQDRNLAYKLQAGLLKIATAYEGYDLALYYNDLQTAYQRTVDIINEVNDYITITFPEEITPFTNQQGGSSHPPVSINPSFLFGASLAGQVLSFSEATTGHGGMLKQLSGNATDYIGGDGNWHVLTGGGDVFKTDFEAFDSVRAITAQNITNWNTSPAWANITGKPTFFSGSYNDLTNKPSLFSGSYTDLTNKPSLFSGSYNDLTDKPSLFSGSYTDLTDKPTLFNGTFAALSGKPNTLSGYGITDGLLSSSPAGSIINSGTGDKFLADDLSYKYPLIHGASDKQLVFIDGTVTLGNANLTFDKTTGILFANKATIGTGLITSELDFTNAGVSIKRQSNDLLFTNTTTSKTLTQLISGATNYWTASGSDIYFGTGTNKVGINQSSPTLAELEVVGHIVANDFDSNFIRYKNSNLLIGPNAGDGETGNDFVYIANSNTATPLFKGDFVNQMATFNADTYINSVKRLCFGNSDVFIHRDGDDLTFGDLNANSGAPITLTQLSTLTGYIKDTDFMSFTTVASITAGNKATWNLASMLHNSGPSTNFLAEDGLYHAGSGGGVTPISYTWKWDTDHYLPYISKADAGGASSAGKFWTGTGDPTANNPLKYDGSFTAASLLGIDTIYGNGVYGFTSVSSGYAVSGTAVGDGGVGGYFQSTNGDAVLGYATGIGVAGNFRQNDLSTANIIQASHGSTVKTKIDKDGNVEILDPSSGVILNTASGRYKIQVDDSGIPTLMITTL
jgi:hypothetical protein